MYLLALATLFAQVPIDPATLLTGNNLIIAAVVIGGGILLYRNRVAIGSKLAGSAPAATGTGTTGGLSSDLANLREQIKSDIADIKKGVASSEPIQALASEACKTLLPVADALPNAAKAAEIHTKLRDCFVEFGDPTAATPENPVAKA